jgi:hypothetical protein
MDHQVLASIDRTVGRLESKVDTLLERQHDLGERVDSLESDRDKRAGVTVAVAGGTSFFVTILAAFGAWVSTQGSL